MSPSPAFTRGRVKQSAKMVAFSLLALLSLILAACGSGPSTTTTPKNTVLNIVPSPKGDFTQEFSPYSTSADYGTQGMIYETLLFFDSLNGTTKPWLAQSYQFSSDAKTITFHLRQNVQWSDKTPFTADDVVFTLNMLKQYPDADTNNLWQTIQSVTAPDQYTVVVTLSKPSSPILWYLGGQTYIVPKHLFSSVGDPAKYVNAHPVGTGPFVLNSFTPQLIDLKKNANYWQPGKPQVSEIRYPSFDSNTGAQLLLSNGGVDWTGLFTPNIQQTYVNRDPAHNHYWFPPNNIVTLYLNDAKAPWNKVAVRKAISDVIDRNQLYKVGESGYEPPASPTGLVLPANQSFLDSTYAGSSFSVDIAAAKQELQSAGVDLSGKSFNIDVVTGWTDWVTDCQIIATDLKALGINATVNALSFNAYFSALQQGNFDMAVSWTNPGPTPYYLYNSMLNSKNTAPIGQNASSNFERWSDSTTDQLLNQFATSADPSVQKQAIYGLQKIMVEQMPTIPLVFGATWNEYSSAKFTGWPSASDPYASPAPFNFPDSEVVVLNLKPVS